MYDAEAHKAEIARKADEAYKTMYAKAGAEQAYWARRRVYGHTYPGINYSRLGALRCDRPMEAPLDSGATAEDMRYHVLFTIDHVESHFGDSMVQDTSGRWHEIEDVRVIDWYSKHEIAARKQDAILARLEAAYGL
jgi:hypothetical protein